MSADYQAVGWNKFKIGYDLFIFCAVLLYLGGFIIVSIAFYRFPQEISPLIILIRAFGTCAFILLHFILLIGPLARVSSLFKPLLYNRRHLGVTMFLIATAHIFFVMVWYHGYGVLIPLLSVFVSNPNYSDLARFPFEIFGVAAYVIILAMALTSHDFWLKLFGAPVWKLLHMGVYVAYFLLVSHVLFGYVRAESSVAMFYTVAGGAGLLVFVHLLAGIKEAMADKRTRGEGEWTPLCRADALENERGMGFTLKKGDKVAVFRYDNRRICAVANACAHQNGPLCEGRIIGGKIVCPWHGYEYEPATGCSPPPFTERIPVYEVRIRKGTVEVRDEPLPLGSKVKPAVMR